MNFSEIYLQFGRTPSKMFACPVQGRKILKYIGFKGHQIISWPMTPMCWAGPAQNFLLNFCVHLSPSKLYFLFTVTY